MKLRRWICFLWCLVLTVCLCAPALADGELFFVAVSVRGMVSLTATKNNSPSASAGVHRHTVSTRHSRKQTHLRSFIPSPPFFLKILTQYTINRG